jgi:hypothetical protein
MNKTITLQDATPHALIDEMSELRVSREAFLGKIKEMPISDALDLWLRNLKPVTARNYRYYVGDLIRRGIIPSNHNSGSAFTVSSFNEVVHEAMVDHIKQIADWSEGTRQVKAACYIGFTSFLERITSGWFRRALPSTLESNKTFFQIREKCATNAITLLEWHRFIIALEGVNERDALIAKAMFQGAKRVSEVLSLTLPQIDFEKNAITYRQSKTRGLIKEITVSYPESFMSSLKAYIQTTSTNRKDGLTVFITREGNQIFRTRLNESFKKASEIAGVGRVTPHVLRTTWVTYAKSQGCSNSEIQKVTGHCDKMVNAYDKTDGADNPTRKLILV